MTWLTKRQWQKHLENTLKEWLWRLVTFETSDQSDEEWLRRQDLTNKNTMTNTNTMTKTFREYPQRVTQDLWPLRHLIRVMRRLYLADKKTKSVDMTMRPQKVGSILGGFTPSKNFFFPTPGSSSSFTKIANYAGVSAKVLRKLWLCGGLISFTPTANSTNKLDLSKLCEFCIKSCAERRKITAVNWVN